MDISHFEGNHRCMPDGNGGFIMYPSALNIIWGKDPRYWKLPNDHPENDQAELIQVCWLEVTGWCDHREVKPNQTYKVQFVLKLTPDAFGFNELPIYFMAKCGTDNKWNKILLPKAEVKDGCYIIPDKLNVKTTAEDKKIYFGLYEVWSGKWKGGLIIRKVIIEETKDE